MSPREKRLWLRVGGWVVLIYGTLYFVRGPVEYLRERNLLRLAVAVVFVGAALFVLRAVFRRKPGRMELVVLGLGGLAYLVALAQTRIPEERLHFIEYGVLASLVYSALLERHKESRGEARELLWVPVGALLITTGLGWADEGLQHLLPNRVYDLRDVRLNLLAALLVVTLLYGQGWARRFDSKKGS